VTELCPAIGTDPICQSEKAKTLSTTVIDTNANDTSGRLSKPIRTPEQEINAIRGKSGSQSQIDVDRVGAASAMTSNLLLVATGLMLFAASSNY
jgi:hypothetical protein